MILQKEQARMKTGEHIDTFGSEERDDEWRLVLHPYDAVGQKL
jgi:hypothetical protein